MSEREVVEIGEAREILLDRLYIVHRRGDAVEEARIIKGLMDRYGLSQNDLASLLGVSQMQVSRLLNLLTLEPEFLERIAEGTLKHSTAFELAKLPVRERLEFLDREKILLKDVVRRRRDLRIEEPLKGIAREEPPLEGAERWWAGLPREEKIRVYSLHRKVDE